MNYRPKAKPSTSPTDLVMLTRLLMLTEDKFGGSPRAAMQALYDSLASGYQASLSAKQHAWIVQLFEAHDLHKGVQPPLRKIPIVDKTLLAGGKTTAKAASVGQPAQPTQLAQCQVTFIAKSRGGLETLPTAPRYAAQVRIDKKWQSLVCLWTDPTQRGLVRQAHANFLSPAAPKDALVPGSKWELFEHNHKVADLVVQEPVAATADKYHEPAGGPDAVDAVRTDPSGPPNRQGLVENAFEGRVQTDVQVPIPLVAPSCTQ